jgi:hypothetical protein
VGGWGGDQWELGERRSAAAPSSTRSRATAGRVLTHPRRTSPRENTSALLDEKDVDQFMAYYSGIMYKVGPGSAPPRAASRWLGPRASLRARLPWSVRRRLSDCGGPGPARDCLADTGTPRCVLPLPPRCAPQAILVATQRSFAAIKRRVGSHASTGIFFLERPFFDVDIELKVGRRARPGRQGGLGADCEARRAPGRNRHSRRPPLLRPLSAPQVPNVTVNPTLEAIQQAINSTAKTILQVRRRLGRSLGAFYWRMHPTSTARHGSHRYLCATALPPPRPDLQAPALLGPAAGRPRHVPRDDRPGQGGGQERAAADRLRGGHQGAGEGWCRPCWHAEAEAVWAWVALSPPFHSPPPHRLPGCRVHIQL